MSSTRNIRHPLVHIGAFTFLLALFVVSASAQTNKGTITGTVTDQSNAVVQNAVVTVTNLETAADRTVNSGDDGTFHRAATGAGKI